ncbi:hypothetical protein R9C00_23575 [Flammeovirgaceae bacterium SG7u.111]|nr:hypothetical protein [Flammeovirgaceae bacterium SG7u.132]WPO34686.1 hypothetical protein R9C00_23575 [Flammeovirgaceae bacterium SG7u.111]
MQRIKAVYLLSDDQVKTFGYFDEQFNELEGKYTKELHKKIMAKADSFTKWHDFPTLGTSKSKMN